ncbi:MAG: hypothetical protein WCG52_10645 [bacterium]
MIAPCTERELLFLQLFERIYGSLAQDQYSTFIRRLDALQLGWVLKKARKDDFPPNPGLEEGFPPFFHYYIPGSQRGSHNPVPIDPLGSDFTARADGVGLNMGCPIRLARALAVLEQHEPHFDFECSRNISIPHKHLPTVEELLWADTWMPGLTIDRNTRGNGAKTPDWRVIDQAGNIFVEAKFLGSDWARLVDGPIHQPKEVLKRAARQLPINKLMGELNVVGVTGLDEMDRAFGETLANDLQLYPHIDAVVYRGLLSNMWVLSLFEDTIHRLSQALRPQSATDFQPHYPITWNRSDKVLRDQLRSPIPSQKEGIIKGTLFFAVKEIAANVHKIRKPPFTYRRNLINRENDGEPIFRIEAPYILKN